MAMTRRAEILFTEPEYAELRREARRRKVSVGELVREAVRQTYFHGGPERRAAAFDWLLSQQVDAGTWEEAKTSIGRYVDREP